MKRMTYLCRIGRTSLGLPRQAKADMSIKTAQLPALCLLNQYGIKKLSTVSDNKSKKCLVKSGKDKLKACGFHFLLFLLLFSRLALTFHNLGGGSDKQTCKKVFLRFAFLSPCTNFALSNLVLPYKIVLIWILFLKP